MSLTFTVELSRGESRVIHNQKEYKRKTSWIKSLKVKDIEQLLKDGRM